MTSVDDLIDDVKNYLDITWQDSKTDEKLSGMIERSMIKLNNLTGSDLDYLKEGTARELLFLRVMYDRSGALDDFQKNYSSDLNSFVMGERMKRYVEQEQDNR